MAQSHPASPALREILLSITELALFSVVARRLAEAAMQLTGADFAAIGAYDELLGLERFEAVGITEQERSMLSRAPDGSGVLGEFARSQETINVASVAEHPRAVGIPDGHPPVAAFLGVPVRYASQPIGAFYVGRRPGARPFSSDDQQALEELAPYAAIAMANARMLETEHNRAMAAEALADAARGLQRLAPQRQTGEVLADALEAIFEDAVALAICWRTASDGAHQHPPRWDDTPLSRALDAFLDRGVEPGHSDAVELDGVELDGDGAADRATVQVAGLEGGGWLALAVGGAVPVTIGESGRVSLRTLAEIGAIGLTAGRRREAETELERYAVRDEIARDLHDDLIQSIYAIGLSLRAVRVTERPAESAIFKASDDLNAVIRDLRSYIVHLSQRTEGMTSAGMLATRVEALLHEGGTQVPWAVDIELGDRHLGRHLERQLYLVVREAVSNVERHSGAEEASLRLARSDDTLHLEISDDGRGFDRSAVPEESVGLRSVEERIASLGGSVVIASSPGQGASLIATVPIPELNDGG